jgi:predicted negative regulator of RcsB-dependent stress response
VDDLLSEKEQIDQIRTWWSEYGGYVIGGLGLGIAILVGFNYYESNKLEAQLEGSSLYETLTGHVVAGQLEEAEAVADDLALNYADTTYAAQAKLALARLYMDKNRDQDAADVLREVVDGDADEAVRHVARTRLARVLQYQGNAQGVVDLLDGEESAAFAATWSELLGDAYRELGRIEDAQAAYQAALLDPMAQMTVDQQLLQWKVLDLPEVEVAREAAPLEEPAGEDAVEVPEDEGSE